MRCYYPSSGSGFFPGHSSGLALEANKSSTNPASVSPKGLCPGGKPLRTPEAGASAPFSGPPAREGTGGSRSRGRQGAPGRIPLLAPAAAVCAGGGPPTVTELPAKRGPGLVRTALSGEPGVLDGLPCWPTQPQEPIASASAHRRVSRIPEALQCPSPRQRPVSHRPILLAWVVLATSPSCLLRGHTGNWGNSGPWGHNREGARAAGSSLRATRRCWRKGSYSQGTCAPTRARVHTHTT